MSLQAISRLLDMLLLNLSADVQHVVECVTDGQSASALAVLWRVRGGQSNLLRAKVHVLSCVGVLCFDDMSSPRHLLCKCPCMYPLKVYLCVHHRASRS